MWNVSLYPSLLCEIEENREAFYKEEKNAQFCVISSSAIFSFG